MELKILPPERHVHTFSSPRLVVGPACPLDRTQPVLNHFITAIGLNELVEGVETCLAVSGVDCGVKCETLT